MSASAWLTGYQSFAFITCRVIVTAVYKKTTMPELHFFNNCFHDEFSTREYSDALKKIYGI